MLTTCLSRRAEKRGRRSAIIIGAIGVLAPGRAHAHFILDQPVLPGQPACWMSEGTDGAPEKTGPCGNEGGGTPTGKVTAFQSGQTITMTINEVVPHAGWYRVSLVAGRSSSQTTTTLPDPSTPASSCAATIVSSPTLPILADGVLRHQSAFSMPQSLQVMLPTNITCTDASPCTLQVVEVMNDGAHFPPGCFYHHCADVTIGAPGADGGSSGGSDASVGADASQVSSDAGGLSSSSGSGGCSCLIAPGGGIPAVAGLAGFAAVTAVRRRRRKR
jgi:hypothetical protein